MNSTLFTQVMNKSAPGGKKNNEMDLHERFPARNQTLL